MEQYDSSVNRQAQQALYQQAIQTYASKLERTLLRDSGICDISTVVHSSSFVDERPSDVSREGALAFSLSEYNTVSCSHR